MFSSIKEALEKGKGKVAIRGWIYRERNLSDKVFLVVRDSSEIVQCIVKKDNGAWNDANKLLIESSVEIEGEIREDKRAPTGYEIDVEKLNVIHFAEKYPITKDQSIEHLADMRHLWLRSRKMTSILKIRSTIFGAIHEYFRKNGFYEYQSPIFQPTQSEGGSTVFKVNYFGHPMFLAQTWKLQADGEELLKAIVKEVLDKNKDELKILERDVSKLEPTLKKKFPRITYDDALKLLKTKKVNVIWGKDLRTIEEDKLSELYDTPVFVSRYPKKVKAFYMKEDPENSEVVLGFDAIAPEGFGEIIGGSQREEDIEKIEKNLKNQGEDPENYDFYLDTRRYGSVPHAGFGMGVERVISWICGLESIRDSIPFPRTMVRFKP